MTFKGRTTRGKARLESHTLQFRGGEGRLSIPFTKVSSIAVRDGTLSLTSRKGRPEVSERTVMAAGKAAGLVDVKVVGFSPTHTAEKFVIPVSQRG